MALTESLTETAAIEILRSELGVGALGSAFLKKRGFVGIGDDAATLPPGLRRLVWTIDTSAEGVHFDLSWLSVGQAAARATTAAMSDLAAMAARPVAALCALTVPPEISRQELRAIARGQRTIAERHTCPIIGGNLCRGTRIEFTTTVLGSVDEPRPRNAARIGDEVWLVGDVGLAAAGLLLLQRRGSRAPRGRLSLPANECITAWREPRALIERGQKLGSRARALIDISDGLANEAGHLGRASRVRIVLSGPRLRNAAKPELCAVAAQLGKDPLELMLYGGEDYALLATGPSASRPRWAICVGSVKAGAGAWLERELGTKPERLRSGFDHLAQ